MKRAILIGLLLLAVIGLLVWIFSKKPSVLIFGEKNIDLMTKDLQHVSSQPLPFSGRITWACKTPNGIILCNETESKVVMWDLAEGVVVKEYNIEQLIAPVGCAYINDLLYVVCFGKDAGTSGIGIFDIDNIKAKNIVQRTDFPDHHLHHISELTLSGKKTIVVCDLGNPWSSPIQKGGLFALEGSKFRSLSTFGYSARSVTQSGDIVMCLTQKPTVLYKFSVKNGKLINEEQTKFQEYDGDGGADVFFGHDSVFATVRYGGDKPGVVFQLQDKSITHTDVVVNPRYTTMLSTGAIVSCGQTDKNEITVFTPEKSDKRTLTTVANFPSFVLEI